MLKIETTARYRKDYRLMHKRGLDLSRLDAVIQKLRNGEILEANFRDHALSGNYVGFRECHITPDWLFIYAIDNDKLILTASRTGSHSDLF